MFGHSLLHIKVSVAQYAETPGDINYIRVLLYSSFPALVIHSTAAKKRDYLTLTVAPVASTIVAAAITMFLLDYEYMTNT